MAKKNRQNPPKPKQFQSVPFSTLKGVVVPDSPPVRPEIPVPAKQAEPEGNDLNLFLQAVADVRPIRKKNSKDAVQETDNQDKKETKTKVNIPTPEDAAGTLFLQEISRLRLDTKFHDATPDDGEIKPLSGNRLRQVKRGVVSVEYQLDLHGLRREEALGALPVFLKSARSKGQKAVLVITGKGHHLAEEPVLQQAVTSWLREAGREIVVEFAPAPREMGGSGAFVVFLRPVPPGR